MSYQLTPASADLAYVWCGQWRMSLIAVSTRFLEIESSRAWFSVLLYCCVMESRSSSSYAVSCDWHESGSLFISPGFDQYTGVLPKLPPLLIAHRENEVSEERCTGIRCQNSALCSDIDASNPPHGWEDYVWTEINMYKKYVYKY